MRPLAAWLRANRWLSLLLPVPVLAGWPPEPFNPDIAGTEKPMEFAFINSSPPRPLFRRSGRFGFQLFQLRHVGRAC